MTGSGPIVPEENAVVSAAKRLSTTEKTEIRQNAMWIGY